ncbi:FUSC family protein [Paracoccus sp. KR1-242]|uniref:FUSC family protein n=1 Tax=Paracoccus sp. KR1-242 TaxID=3410028 RepID=UPI003C0E489D
MNPAFSWALRALQLFAAAAISLVIAVQLGLHNPFWAAMPVWVVAQPHREDLLLRAILRVAGTALGAVLGWWALTLLPDAGPRILVLGLAVGLGTAIAYWIGSVYSYGVLLAAITVAVVLVPAMDHPVDAAALALDRIWCTMIGVVAVTVITFLFTPPRPEPLPPRRAPRIGAVIGHGLIAAGAAMAGTLVLLLIGGPAGVGTALSLSIFSLIIGSNRNPAPILTYMPPASAIGVAAALGYRGLDFLLPDPAGMALALALPFIAAGAILRAHPRTAPLGLDANMCFLLAAEAGTKGHGFGAHVLGGLALVLSAYAFTAFFRRFGTTPPPAG